MGLCLGPYGGPREVEVSHERGTPVGPIETFRAGFQQGREGGDTQSARRTHSETEMPSPPPTLLAHS